MNSVTWHREVKARFGFKCAICGSTNKLESHHIKPRHLYPELSLDIYNGLCLCHKCHYYYHNGKFNSPIDCDTWQGIQIPDMEVYNRVKEFRNRIQLEHTTE